MEERIAAVYRRAYEDKLKSVDEYFARLSRDDAKQKKLVEEGKLDEGRYKRWRKEEYFRGELYAKMRDELAERMTHANEIAMAYVNDDTPGVYSINRNFSAYQIEAQVGDCNFTLFDERTVRRLLVEDPDVMPYYPPERAVRRGIDLDYGKKQIRGAITSGILQGSSVDRIAKDMREHITTMSYQSAVRAARTATTAAQNAGRVDGYFAAERMGIGLKKQWLATLDKRTRHSHAMLDGVAIANDKCFENGCMFPGDPGGAPEEVYNCRCTLLAVVEDAPYENAQRRAKSSGGKGQLIGDMSFREWMDRKAGEKKVANSAQSGTIKTGPPPKVYRQFESGDAANEFFYYDGEERGLMAKKSSEHNKWMKSLSKEERDCISDYTGGGYYDLNEYLRKTGDWENINPEKAEYLASNIDAAISRYKLRDNIRVQRGVMEDVLDKLTLENDVQNSLQELVGKKYTEQGYSSSTVLRNYSVATAKPVIFDIEIPAGVGRGAYVNELAGQFQNTEYEFLIKRNATFTIKEVIEEEVLGEYRYYIKLVMDDE